MEGLEVYWFNFERCAADKPAVNNIAYYHMLHFVVSGHGICNGQRINPGQAFLCRANTHNHYYPDPEDPWSYYWVDASGVLADSLLDSCGFANTDIIDFDPSSEVVELLKLGMKCTAPNFRCGMFLALTGLLQDYEFELMQSEPMRHVKNAVSIIHACSGQITPSELAVQLCLSRKYLRNIFVKYKGISPQDYIIRYRMRCAADLLEQTDCTIREIAAEVGYDDQFQMSRQFHKVYGYSPTQHRRFTKFWKKEIEDRRVHRKK